MKIFERSEEESNEKSHTVRVPYQETISSRIYNNNRVFVRYWMWERNNDSVGLDVLIEKQHNIFNQYNRDRHPF